MADSARRLAYRLLATGLCAVLLAAALWAGFELGQVRVTSIVQPEVAALDAQRLALLAERGALRDELVSALRERVISERDRQIDRETARALTDQLKEAQDVPSAEPRAQPIALEYLQSLSGTFELPDDFEPIGRLIGIEPSDNRLIPTSESNGTKISEEASPSL
jgi:hypothetical protein